MADGDRFDVFLSFSTEDRHKMWFGHSIDVVGEIKRALERYRHPETSRRFRVCTYDEDFELDAEIRGAIINHIDRSKAVVFLSTTNAAQSPYVALEITHAAERGSDHPLLGALVDAEPARVFPSTFRPGAHAADLSAAGCQNRAAWRRRIELEAAKIVARVWSVTLLQVRDRFVTDQRRQTIWRSGAVVVSAGLIIASAIGVREYRARELARILGVHQRYSADMNSVQQSWADGYVDQARTLLQRYETAADPDPRSFEWSSYRVVTTAERIALKTNGEVKALAISPVESWIAFSAEQTPITIVDAKNGKPVANLSAATVGRARSRSCRTDPT